MSTQVRKAPLPDDSPSDKPALFLLFLQHLVSPFKISWRRKCNWQTIAPRRCPVWVRSGDQSQQQQQQQQQAAAPFGAAQVLSQLAESQ